jgi:hypothetical protein
MRVTVEQLVEWKLAGETEVLGENLHQHHFVHDKSHMTFHISKIPYFIILTLKIHRIG